MKDFKLITKPYPIMHKSGGSTNSLFNLASKGNSDFSGIIDNQIYWSALAECEEHKSGTSIVIFAGGVLAAYTRGSKVVDQNWRFVKAPLDTLRSSVIQKTWKEEVQTINNKGYAEIKY